MPAASEGAVPCPPSAQAVGQDGAAAPHGRAVHVGQQDVSVGTSAGSNGTREGEREEKELDSVQATELQAVLQAVQLHLGPNGRGGEKTRWQKREAGSNKRAGKF